MCTTSRFKPDNSTHLDKWTKQRNVCSNSRFELRRPKTLDHCFRKQQGHVLGLHVYIRVVLGQPAGLSKEVRLNAGADWLKLLSVGGGGKLVQTVH